MSSGNNQIVYSGNHPSNRPRVIIENSHQFVDTKKIIRQFYLYFNSRWKTSESTLTTDASWYLAQSNDILPHIQNYNQFISSDQTRDTVEIACGYLCAELNMNMQQLSQSADSLRINALDSSVQSTNGKGSFTWGLGILLGVLLGVFALALFFSNRTRAPQDNTIDYRQIPEQQPGNSNPPLQFDQMP